MQQQVSQPQPSTDQENFNSFSENPASVQKELAPKVGARKISNASPRNFTKPSPRGLNQSLHKSLNSSPQHQKNGVKDSQQMSPQMMALGMNPVLDREERDLINLSSNLTKEEIWDKLEQKRFNQLKKAAVNLQSELIFHNRCPKCTLMPPCKHYDSSDQIIQEGASLVMSQPFKQHLSPKKREGIMKAIKEQQKAHHLQNSSNMDLVYETQRTLNQQLNNQPTERLLRDDTQNNIEEQLQDHSQQDASGNTFLTNVAVDQQNFNTAQAQPVQLIRKPDFSQRQVMNRNGFNNTVIGARGAGFRALSESKNSYDANAHQRSNLSQYGSNIMNQQQIKRHYLRKREGNGGSPVEGVIHEGPMLVQGRDQNFRDRTTVRIRTKNNQYVLAEGSFSQPMASAKNKSPPNQRSYMETSQQSLQDRERLQAMIAKYREDKIQRQIEKIEQERMMMEYEKKIEKDKDLKRRQYNDLLKQKLQEYQNLKYKQEEEKLLQQRLEEQRRRVRDQMRRQYMDNQKKFIAEYKEQKRKTDQLLMIPQSDNQDSDRYNAYNQFPKKQYLQDGFNSTGMSSNAGQQQFISGGNSIQKPAAYPNAQQQIYQQDNNQENQLPDYEEDDYDQYYGEVDQEELMNQQHPTQQQKLKAQKKQMSQGVIGELKQPSSQQQSNHEGEGQGLTKKKDSLDLIDNNIV